MAIRPVFLSNIDLNELVIKENIDFKWYPGFSITQKQKSICSLHTNFNDKYPDKRILEISSKSIDEVGRKLSAFNLMYKSAYYDRKISVECIFQGSKVFEDGGPYEDLLFKLSKLAKQDNRIKSGSKLKYFQFEQKKWPIEPKTLFYDWIYINALWQNKDLVDEMINYDSFSDIEFNPNKSINCQAKSAALFVALYRLNLLEKIVNSEEEYKKLMNTFNYNSNAV